MGLNNIKRSFSPINDDKTSAVKQCLDNENNLYHGEQRFKLNYLEGYAVFVHTEKRKKIGTCHFVTET